MVARKMLNLNLGLPMLSKGVYVLRSVDTAGQKRVQAAAPHSFDANFALFPPLGNLSFFVYLTSHMLQLACNLPAASCRSRRCLCRNKRCCMRVAMSPAVHEAKRLVAWHSNCQMMLRMLTLHAQTTCLAMVWVPSAGFLQTHLLES
eukprot:4491227-Amphidinium_carterae.1